MVPDQTVLWKDRVWAVEHHLSGPFQHAGDYQRLIEEEGYTLCGWWRPELRIGLLGVTGPEAVEHVRGQLLPGRNRGADVEGGAERHRRLAEMIGNMPEVSSRLHVARATHFCNISVAALTVNTEKLSKCIYNNRL